MIRRQRGRVARLMRVAVLSVVALATGSCIHIYASWYPRPIDPAAVRLADTTRVVSPLKVHLVSGATVIYQNGALISRTRIVGEGLEYPLLSNNSRVRRITPMDSVVAVETFEQRVSVPTTVVVSVAATGLASFGALVLGVALFGSCPTVYVEGDFGLELQAEGFSYAIAPLFEHRDVDPLRARVGADGRLKLELRNEALETHFINHVELLASVHASDARVVPDQRGAPVAVAGLLAVAGAVDRAGRDVRATLAEADGELFSTAESTLASAREGDLDDWIDLHLSELPPGDSVAVVLRLRNSLLNTILMYEGLLGGHDALDWQTAELGRIASAVDLGRWYSRTLGMRAFVDGVTSPEADPSAALARLGDVGPIAFRDVAIILPRPVPDATEARVRLRFVADNWRIDQVLASGVVTRPDVRVIPVTEVVVSTPTEGDGPVRDTAAERAIAEADESYLETRPGQRMTLVFDVDEPSHGVDSTQTFLIAWQGWYREWIRGSWLAAPTRVGPFVPGDAAIVTALRRWREQQSEFERQFYATKIPVR